MITPAAPPQPPLLGIASGDPAGIGPELCLQALNDATVTKACTPVVFGSAPLLQRVAHHCHLPLTATIITADAFTQGTAPQGPSIIDCPGLDAATVRPGTIDAACGHAAHDYICRATQATMQGRLAALVTAPIHKEALHAAGIPHPGHTELLTALTGAKTTRMMMASDDLIVTLATIHIALAEVPRQLTTAGILETLVLTHQTLLRLGHAQPRITVCALNPHAGEGGLFGDEEARLITPAITAARARGIRASDPIAPDTAFTAGRRAATDAYIAMYHDQGLIPFKMLAFETGVNITLGLPILRTSVDHGTAFDIAWTGQATPTSLYAAITWALRLLRSNPRPDPASPCP